MSGACLARFFGQEKRDGSDGSEFPALTKTKENSKAADMAFDRDSSRHNDFT